MNRLNETLVLLICATMAGMGAHNAEQDIFLPWREKHQHNPVAANLDVACKIFKQPVEIRAAIDEALAKAGNLADQTLVGV